MIPPPPCPVVGAVHIQRCSGPNWMWGRAADKEKKRKHWHKASSSSLSCLSVTFVCWGFINFPVRLGKYQRCFQDQCSLLGGLFSLLFRTFSGQAFEKKRKWNWRKCLFPCSSRMQGSLPITFAWSLALVLWHLGKLSSLLATPASPGCVCPQAPLFFPTYQWVS